MKRLANAIRRRRAPSSIIHGYPVRLDAEDVLQLSVFGEYEPLETEIVRRALRPPDTVLDVGAHIGYYTLLAARRASFVYAFEPTPDTYAILTHNVRSNGLGNVRTIQAAVGERAGQARLTTNAANCGDNHIAMDGVPVSMVSIDSLLPGLSVQFVKLDIQGYEPAALRGMAQTLRRSAAHMLIEYSPSDLLRAGFSASELLDLLVELGFRYSHVDRSVRRVVPTTREAMLAYPGHHTYLWCDKGIKTAISS